MVPDPGLPHRLFLKFVPRRRTASETPSALVFEHLAREAIGGDQQQINPLGIDAAA